jgi:hypothetical protein
MAKDDVTTTGGSTSPPDPLRAYRITVEMKYDLEQEQITLRSWSLDGFSLTGRDLFALLDRLPAEIEQWFQKHRGAEVLVLPVHWLSEAKARRMEDGYVAVPIRPLAAALRAMEPKP